jgi:hypothetical protein
MDVVDRIEGTETGPGDRPVNEIAMEGVDLQV